MNEARRERDKGIGKVIKPNEEWLAKGLAEIRCFPHGWTGTGEDARIILEPKIGHPTHHNAWGALISVAYRQEIIERTGQFKQMRQKKSHARISREYVKH